MTAHHRITLICDECGETFCRELGTVRAVRKIAKDDQGWSVRHHGNQDVCGECTRANRQAARELRDDLNDEDDDDRDFKNAFRIPA